MSIVFNPTTEQLKALEDWKLTRPKVIQEMIEKFPPNILYKLKETNQNVMIYSYSEDGTLTINIYQEYNPHLLLMGSRQVFGIKQESLEESDFNVEGIKL